MSVDLLKVADVQERLNISRSAAYTLMKTGALRVVHPTPGTTRVRSDDLDAYIEKVTEARPRRVRLAGRAS